IADPNQLEMALLNLAVNARDAMPEGGTITISAEPAKLGRRSRVELPPGEYVKLSVADTGTGMDERTLQRAVEPFFSTKGVGQGTGLGLSMVHGLAAQLGGAMTIASRAGLGTKIELWLRIAEAAAEHASSDHDAQLTNAAGTALLVDDEDLVRASTAEMLGELGYSVVQAKSAEDALALVNEGLTPSLLVTDHLMPGMTGVEFARTMRSMDKSVAVLIISGYAESEGIAPDLPRLEKPFRQADLAKALCHDPADM
ncbi:MAG TPA: ATP-binding protein, partial [Sphingomicrobium sp.]